MVIDIKHQRFLEKNRSYSTEIIVQEILMITALIFVQLNRLFMKPVLMSAEEHVKFILEV